MPRSLLILGLVVAASGAALAEDGAVTFGAHDVPSVFFISKSENHNQVHYAVRLDAQCAPRGATPVLGYWQNLEVGPNDTTPLLSIEQRAYGIAEQSVTGSHIALRLRALRDRPIRIDVGREGSACYARAFTNVNGREARLDSAHVRLGMLGPRSIQLRAHQDGAAVTETVEP